MPDRMFQNATKIKGLSLEFFNHPPYSPDMAPEDYYLFWSVVHSLRGKKFDNLSVIENYLDNFFYILLQKRHKKATLK